MVEILTNQINGLLKDPFAKENICELSRKDELSADAIENRTQPLIIFNINNPSQNNNNFKNSVTIKAEVELEFQKILFDNYVYLEWLFGSLEYLSEQIKINKSESSQDAESSQDELNRLESETKFYLALLSFYLCYFYNKLHPSDSQALKYKKSFLTNQPMIGFESEFCPLTAVQLTMNANEIFTLDRELKIKPVYKLLSVRNFRTELFGITNWFRLYVIRVGRLIASIIVLLVAVNIVSNAFVNALTAMSHIFNIAAPVFAWLSFLYYLPRLLVNISLLIKHTYNDKIEGLNHSERRKIQWERRKFQILNDSVWLGNGLTVFIIAKTVATAIATPVGFILIGFLYYFDVWNAWDYYKKAKEIQSKLLEYSNSSNAMTFCSSISAYASNEVEKKYFLLKSTIGLAIGMTPVFISGILSLIFGLGVLLNPYVAGGLLLGAIFVLVVTTYSQFHKESQPIDLLKIPHDKAASLNESDLSLPLLSQSQPQRIVASGDGELVRVKSEEGIIFCDPKLVEDSQKTGRNNIDFFPCKGGEAFSTIGANSTIKV